MGWVVPAVAVVSTVIQAVQTKKAGNAAAKAGLQEQEARNAAGRLFDWNAGVAELQARDAEARGVIDEARFRQQISKFIGTQRTVQAASGTDVNYGSNVDVQADTAYLGELDALTIRTNAAREAWGYRVEGVDMKARAEISRKSGVQAAEAGRAQRSAANWSIAGNILGTGSSLLAAKYGFGKQQKTFTPTRNNLRLVAPW